MIDGGTSNRTVSRRVLGLNMALLSALPLLAILVLPTCGPSTEVILRSSVTVEGDAGENVGHLIEDISRLDGVRIATVRVDESGQASVDVIHERSDMDGLRGAARRSGFEVAYVAPARPSVLR